MAEVSLLLAVQTPILRADSDFVVVLGFFSVACFCICFGENSLASSLLFHRLTQRHLSSQQLCWVMTLVSHYRIIKLPLERWYQWDVFCFPIKHDAHSFGFDGGVHFSAVVFFLFACTLREFYVFEHKAGSARRIHQRESELHWYVDGEKIVQYVQCRMLS